MDFKQEPSNQSMDFKQQPSRFIDNDYSKNCIVFPLLNSVNYRSINDIFEIEIPKHVSDWLCKLLPIIVASDLKQEVDAYAWLVLLHPSLILISSSKSSTISTELKALAIKTMNVLRAFMVTQANSCALELNDALICAELYGNECEDVPDCVWEQINELMENTNTDNQFIKLTCRRSKDIKMVQQLTKCTANTVNSKTRNCWIAFIGVLTQIVRLHRLYKTNGNQLSQECKSNILKVCGMFDDTYQCALRKLMHPLKKKSDKVKVDYAYYRYKTMAMCTHSATTIPATFAGYFGFVESEKESNIDVTLMNVMVGALQDDIDRFIRSVDKILDAKQKGLLKGIDKMPKRDTAGLRILDNICYNSLCCMIMYRSLDDDANNKLMAMRKDIRCYIERSAKKLSLFCETMDGLNENLLHSCFLTYDKQQKSVWSHHLMSGILLNYWIYKSQ